MCFWNNNFEASKEQRMTILIVTGAIALSLNLYKIWNLKFSLKGGKKNFFEPSKAKFDLDYNSLKSNFG